MSRVSESSSFHAIKHSVGKTKSRLEDLHIKGSNLKRVQKPSDDPVGNMEILEIRSKKIDGGQYQRNASVAKAQLSFAESALEELTDIMTKAKELAIGQSSNLFDVSVRRGVAKEVEQLRNQAISIANRRIGNKYIFSGFKSLTKPFDMEGNYQGDENQTKIEVSKDFYVPISFNGRDIFFDQDGTKFKDHNPLKDTPFDKDRAKAQEIQEKEEQKPIENDFLKNRELASVEGESTIGLEEPAVQQSSRRSILDDLKTLHSALVTNNHEVVRDLLPRFDGTTDRLIQARTQVGSIVNSIDSAVDRVQKEELVNEEYKSKIEDADVTELFTDLARQQNVLNATYKASSQLMNRSLMDYIN